jgi:3-deoxy-7-phosphoheptulonate synthase
VRDRRIERVVPLIAPDALLVELPLSDQQADVVVRGRSHVQAVLDREDDRLLVVVGPCSVHDPDAALSYAARLRERSADLEDDLVLVMRVYFEKPRTTTGWKGMINDPHLDGSGDVNEGLRMARKLLLEVLELGLPVGCEFLDPITPQYIADAVSWGAIGARTTESQIHRQLTSGLSMPVGFKNRTDGDVGVAVDAVRAAAVPHSFAGIDVDGTPAILHTRGNPDCHVILRGGRDAPNYSADSVGDAVSRLRSVGLPERVVMDASHDNSGKDHEHQPTVVRDLADQIAAGNEGLVGVMLESFILAGRQDLQRDRTPVYGQSITDACMSWETTVETLDELAAAVRARRTANRLSLLRLGG